MMATDAGRSRLEVESEVMHRGQLSQITQVLQRLNQKARLNAVARDILIGLRGEKEARNRYGELLFVGEHSKSTVCGKDPETGNPPPDPSKFECAQNAFACLPKDLSGANFECHTDETKFDCAGLNLNFDCPSIENFTCKKDTQFECDTDTVYGSCGGMTEKFDCEKGEYNCGGNENSDDKIFDCHDFDCETSKDGGGPAFECDTLLDFNCGEKFVCKNEFECEGGHVFICSLDHDCDDKFNCKSTGETPCTQTEYQYDNPQGPDPGDFSCGTGVPGQPTTDDFDCLDVFGCLAKDEFDCPTGAKFDCGTGEGTDKFECDPYDPGTNGGFDCEPTSNFRCNPEVNFDCTRPNDYACTNPTGKYEDAPDPPS